MSLLWSAFLLAQASASASAESRSEPASPPPPPPPPEPLLPPPVSEGEALHELLGPGGGESLEERSARWAQQREEARRARAEAAQREAQRDAEQKRAKVERLLATDPSHPLAQAELKRRRRAEKRR